MTLIYCLLCKKKTETENETINTSGKVKRIVGNCKKCNTKKNSFVKSQSGKGDVDEADTVDIDEQTQQYSTHSTQQITSLRSNLERILNLKYLENEKEIKQEALTILNKLKYELTKNPSQEGNVKINRMIVDFNALHPRVKKL